MYKIDKHTGLEILEGQLGQVLHTFATQTAVPLAVDTGRSYILNWNDRKILVTPNSTAGSIHSDYIRQCDESYDRYRASPAGIKSAVEAMECERDHQHKHDALMASLPGIVNNEPALMTWLSEFSDATDHIGVNGLDFAKVVSLLEGAGYTRGMCSGLDQSAYKDPTTMAKYITGQVISCMVEMGMVPRPNITARFVEDYHYIRK